MPILASVEKLRTSLGFDDMQDINAAVLGALNSATPHLAAKMNMSSFDRQTPTDLFGTPRLSALAGGVFSTQLRLSHGLLTQTPIVIRRATTYAGLANTDHMGDVWLLDRARGVLTDVTTFYEMEFISVSYECGFERETISAGIDAYKDVPDWLQEAATTQALIQLANHPLFKDTGVAVDAKQLRYSLDILMANHIRYAPAAIYPL